MYFINFVNIFTNVAIYRNPVKKYIFSILLIFLSDKIKFKGVVSLRKEGLIQIKMKYFAFIKAHSTDLSPNQETIKEAPPPSMRGIKFLFSFSIQTPGNFLENDFWTPRPPPPLLNNFVHGS